MRGVYKITDEDRRRFFHSLLELCKNPREWQDLISTQLSMSNCDDLLEELGYERDEWEAHGWEGDVWGTCIHRTAPGITLRAEAYSGSLSIMFTGIDDEAEIDTEALKEAMREHWGKYFPVI